MTQTTVSKRLDAAIFKLVGTVTLGTIAVQLDSTMVNVAFNALLKEFHRPLTTIQWVATGYLLAMTTMIPLTGWAVERFGAKRVWMACLLGLLGGSVLCGLSWSMGSLIVFRVIQGLGGGMLIPLAQIVLAQAAGPERFGRVASLMGIPVLLGPVLGPVLGGLIVDDLSWRWIFLVNVPVCVAGLLVSARVLPSARATGDGTNRLDILGLALLSPGLGFIVYGLSEAGAHGRFTDRAPLIGLVAGAALPRELLAATLRFAGFAVTSVATGAEAVDAASAEPPDLVLLDVMLPDLDGFEVVRRLRERAQVPVLFLTARDAPEDKVAGLTLGGDDYVTKPFNLEELIARIRAILRRTGGTAGLLAVGDLHLDPDGHLVTRAGQPVRLSPTEFRLLHFLMRHNGRVVSKAQILDHVWQYDFGGDPSIVDTYISYLRRKVDTSEPKLIQTVHGVGYVLRRPA